jgi:hypothetical protein
MDGWLSPLNECDSQKRSQVLEKLLKKLTVLAKNQLLMYRERCSYMAMGRLAVNVNEYYEFSVQAQN